MIKDVNYNGVMTEKEDMLAYKKGWEAVAEVEREELQNTSIEEKWRQLISIIKLAIGLGIFISDPSEEAVYEQWAKLKENMTLQIE